MSETGAKKASWQIIELDSIDSTNKEAFRLYLQKGNDCLPNLIVSKTQTAGKGQFERKWESPEGNLYCSFSLSKSFLEWKLGKRIDEANLTYEIGLSLKEMLQEIISESDCAEISKLTIKKPNDILYEKKKLAGILVETKADLLVIGIGLNLEISPIPDSTCLREISKETFNKGQILDKLRISIAKKLRL